MGFFDPARQNTTHHGTSRHRGLIYLGPVGSQVVGRKVVGSNVSVGSKVSVGASVSEIGTCRPGPVRGWVSVGLKLSVGAKVFVGEKVGLLEIVGRKVSVG